MTIEDVGRRQPSAQAASRARGADVVHTWMGRAVGPAAGRSSTDLRGVGRSPRRRAWAWTTSRSTATRRRGLARRRPRRVAAGQERRLTPGAAARHRGDPWAASGRTSKRADGRSVGVHCLASRPGPRARTASSGRRCSRPGPRAYLDGDTALVAGRAAQLRAGQDPGHGAAGRARSGIAAPGIDIRQTAPVGPRRDHAEGVPRTKPPGAAVRAALWARSDKPGGPRAHDGRAAGAGHGRASSGPRTLLKVRTGPAAIAAPRHWCWTCRRGALDRRAGRGARVSRARHAGAGPSGGAADVATARSTSTSGGDEYGVVVEVDGVQHGWVQNAVADALRQQQRGHGGRRRAAAPVLGLRRVPPTSSSTQMTERSGPRLRHLDESA